MTMKETRRVSFARISGRFPAWIWRGLFDAQRTAKDALPVLVVEDKGETLVVITLDTYNALVASEEVV